VHHAAKVFDIGVYFEANGHGTVLFSDHARQLISSPPAKYAPSRRVRYTTTTLTGMSFVDRWIA